MPRHKYRNLSQDSVGECVGRGKMRDVFQSVYNEPSFVVITLERWRGGLEQDERFTTEPLAQQGDAVALRVALK